MGQLLEKAIAEAAKLPEAEQEVVGAWILAELESERRWDDLFAKSQDLLTRMRRKRARSIEPVLPSLWTRKSCEVPHHSGISERKLLASLPSEIRDQARTSYQLFAEDPHHPSLHFKQVQNTETQ